MGLLLIGGSVLAQPVQSPPTVCWTARADCQASIILEAGGEFSLLSTTSPRTTGQGPRRDIGGRFVATIGQMWLRSPDAWGGSVSLLNDGRVVGGRLEGRYRRWLATRTSAGSSVGVERWTIGAGGSEEIPEQPAIGLTAGIQLDHAWAGVDGRVSVLRARDGSVASISVGARIREKAVPISVAVLGTLGLFLAYALAHDGH